MKTSLTILSLLAAAAAVALFPVNFEAAGSLLFAVGFGAIVYSDYTTQTRRLSLRAPSALRAATPAPRTERLGLAA